MKSILLFSIILSLNFNFAFSKNIVKQTGLNLNVISWNKASSLYAVGDSGKIKIIDNYSNINSISELLDCFKGKPVFIDLWATWCSPCIQEFKFSKPLKNFLDKNKIEIIYVSFDKKSEELKWVKRIKENKLSGNHIIANQKLQDSLTTLIWGGVGAYSIPHYLLFDQNKKLLNKNSSPPSSGIVLQKEIEFALNKF